MALPNSFANETNPVMSELEVNFAALGAIDYIPCTAAGTNTLILTPAANTPSVNGYTQLQGYSFVAAATNTGGVQIQVLGPSGSPLTLLQAYKLTSAGPALLTAGDIRQSCYYVAVYDSALNAGAGGFHIANTAGLATGNVNPNTVFAGPTSAGAAPPTFRNLVGADLPFPFTASLGGVLALNSAQSQFVNAIALSGQVQTAQVFYSDIGGSISPVALPRPTLTTLGGILALNSATGQVVVAIASSGQPQTASVVANLSISGSTLANVTIFSSVITTTAISSSPIVGSTLDSTPIGNTTSASANVTSLQAQSLNVIGTGAPANGVYLPAANTPALSANGLTALAISSSQQVLVGGQQTVPVAFQSTLVPRITVFGSGTAGSIAIIRHNTPGSGGGNLALAATRAPLGGGAGSALQIGDGLGSVVFYAADGANFVNNGVTIKAVVDNTITTNITPTSLLIQTTNSGGGGGGDFFMSNEGNFGFSAKQSGGYASFGSGSGVLAIANAFSAPTANPVGGGLIYVAANGNLVFRGSNGTITTLASA